MFGKIVALSVLAVWLGLMGLGYAGNDDFGSIIVPSIVTLDNQNCPDDLNGHNLCDLAMLSAVCNMDLPDRNFDQGLETASKILNANLKPFKLNCSFLL